MKRTLIACISKNPSSRAVSLRSALFTALLLAPQATLAAQDTPPVMRWDFGAEDTTKLVPKGDVQRDAPGPRPPEFPDFEPGNTAVKLGGNGHGLWSMIPVPTVGWTSPTVKRSRWRGGFGWMRLRAERRCMSSAKDAQGRLGMIIIRQKKRGRYLYRHFLSETINQRAGCVTRKSCSQRGAAE